MLLRKEPWALSSSPSFELRGLPRVTRLDDRLAHRDDLERGRRELSARFSISPLLTLKAGEFPVAAPGSKNAIYHLVTGWICQIHDFSDGRQAIVDIYLPGEVIGLDADFRVRPFETFMALTSIAMAGISSEITLADLMSSQPVALYIAWLLGQRLRRSNHLLAAMSSHNAQRRLAAMLCDFYKRLSRQKLVTRSTYNLPLTQTQIGSYLGLTVAHVNRVLRSLREDRIVSVEKHCVTILDLEQLTKLVKNGNDGFHGSLTSSLRSAD
jgi:CRP/FNR family transcriptional regulator